MKTNPFLKIAAGFVAGFVVLLLLLVGLLALLPSEQGSESEAKQLASAFVTSKMKKTWPWSGHDPRYTLNAWRFDAGDKTYHLDITGSWLGTPTVFSNECQVVARFDIEMDHNGQYMVKRVSDMNECAVAGDIYEILLEAARN